MADLLVADRLQMTYGKGEAASRALNGVSLSIDRGEIASIVGQSGSGKSTLLNLLGLLATPTEGTIHLDGREVGSASNREKARLRNSHLGFVFQFHHLLPEFSVHENLMMPTRLAAAERDIDNDHVALILDLLGLDGVRDKGAADLSGGQKQRVAIGRALMNKPSLVLADEPTGNLDSQNTDAVYRLFRRINAELKTTFLIVTHDHGLASRTDRVIEVSDGLIVSDRPTPR